MEAKNFPLEINVGMDVDSMEVLQPRGCAPNALRIIKGKNKIHLL